MRADYKSARAGGDVSHVTKSRIVTWDTSPPTSGEIKHFLTLKKQKSISQFHIRCNVLEYRELRVKVQFHPISRNITQTEMTSNGATCAFWGSD